VAAVDLTPMKADALVVGSGPAGLAAAVRLASHGLHTVVVGPAPAAHDDYDVLVSAPTLDAIHADNRPLDTLLVSFDERHRIAYPDPGLVVCQRSQLLAGMLRTATARGGEHRTGTVTAIAKRGDAHVARVRLDGAGIAEIVADHLVIATGVTGTRELVRLSPSQGLGRACAQRCNGAELGAESVLHLQAPSNSDPHAPPSCVRVLPDAAGEPMVTVTVMTMRADDDASALLTSTLHTLSTLDVRLAGLRPVGPLWTAPTSSGFTPELAARNGHLLVGDAAGLVNPFTGEGIHLAVHSGLLAAGAIAANPTDPAAARHGYVRQLTANFVGYFESARHAARRYHLAWRILASTAGSDSPFFAKGRRAVLLPEGIGGLGATEDISLSQREGLLLTPFIMACNEIAVGTVRTEWPFIATLVASGQAPTDHRVRPALLFAATHLLGGKPPENHLAGIATATELAMLGALALIGPGSRPTGPRPRGVDWQLATAVLAGDFLLSQAARLVARHGPDLSAAFADWLAELIALRAQSRSESTADPTDLFAAMFEFPARVGAQLAGVTGAGVELMREFGKHCGRVFLHAEDLLALQDRRTRLDTTLDGLTSTRLSAIPSRLGGDRPAALNHARAACLAALADADAVLTNVEAGTAKRILGEVVKLLAAPAHGNG
jgi:2-polyprenyl-6-methoxyphenol hydroxylase-like FAD-dependent oxidoreductase